MPDATALFETLKAQMTADHERVEDGKMMSSPAITYKGKVFAFYYNDQMVFKLGKDFDPDTHALQHHSLLNPFKNKPPMAAWFCIPVAEHEKWEALAAEALQKMRTELG